MFPRVWRGIEEWMEARPYVLTIDHLLSDEERLTWSAAREFCDTKVAPLVEAAYDHPGVAESVICGFTRGLRSIFFKGHSI